MYNDLLWEAASAFGKAVPQQTKSILQYFVSSKSPGSQKAIMDDEHPPKGPSSSSSASARGGAATDDGGSQVPRSLLTGMGNVLTPRTHVILGESVLAHPDAPLFGKGMLPVPHEWKLVQRLDSSGEPEDAYDVAIKTNKTQAFVRVQVISLRPWTYPQALYANLKFLANHMKIPGEERRHPVWGFSARVITKETCRDMSDFKKVADTIFQSCRNVSEEEFIPLSSYAKEEMDEAKKKRIDQKSFKDNTTVILLPADKFLSEIEFPSLKFDSVAYKMGDCKNVTVPDIVLTELSNDALFDYHVSLYNEVNEPGSSASVKLHYVPPKGWLFAARHKLLSFYDELYSSIDPVDDLFPTALVHCGSQIRWMHLFQYKGQLDEESFRPIQTVEGKIDIPEDEEKNLVEYMNNALRPAGHPSSPKALGKSKEPPSGGRTRTAKGKGKAKAKPGKGQKEGVDGGEGNNLSSVATNLFPIHEDKVAE